MKTVPDFLHLKGNEIDANLKNWIFWILPKKQSCSLGMHCILNVNSRQGKVYFFRQGSHRV